MSVDRLLTLRITSTRWVNPPGVIHLLIVAAVIVFVLWLLFHAAGALVNLLWIVIVVLAIIWLVGLIRGRRA